MKKVQSIRTVKLAQLRVPLCDMLIKRKDNDKQIKLKTVSNLSKITGRRWWMHLYPTSLLQLKTKSKQEH